MKTKGNVAWAVTLYMRVQQCEKALDRNEQTLHSWLSKMTADEVQEYARITTERDAAKAVLEPA